MTRWVADGKQMEAVGTNVHEWNASQRCGGLDAYVGITAERLFLTDNGWQAEPLEIYTGHTRNASCDVSAVDCFLSQSRKHPSKHPNIWGCRKWDADTETTLARVFLLHCLCFGLLDASQMAFPLSIQKAVACINAAHLKRKWFSNVRSRWLLHLVWTPAGSVPPTDHLKLTAAFTQSLNANSYGEGGGVTCRWLHPPHPLPAHTHRKKVLVALVSFPSHLPEHWCSDTTKGFRCMLSNILSRIFSL